MRLYWNSTTEKLFTTAFIYDPPFSNQKRVQKTLHCKPGRRVGQLAGPAGLAGRLAGRPGRHASRLAGKVVNKMKFHDLPKIIYANYLRSPVF